MKNVKIVFAEPNEVVARAQEWRYPTFATPNAKHSIQRNVDIIFGLIRDNKLSIDPLLSHIVSPDEAPVVYDGLRNRKDEYLDVVFDWRDV
ncbi:hypothetical protein A8990_14020 [Paenibacillus taihuensis]|uniref:Uncharacterized protein n=1 Tax=Paenibacillus taihuensis TaxID=1156355 RepID=A0A3D9R0X9_9BACL|nr:hypothetical protein [Paenibacillus taihuensis]REE67971.1 hypothetical protein A8990_14020 [Paenibacillus taihuensis]